MPASRSNLRITVESNGKRFSLNCKRMVDGSYRIKRGRSASKKMPYATITQIFDTARRWAVKEMRDEDN